MQLSKKQKAFSQFFAQFLKFTLILKHFKKPDNPHSLCVSENRNRKRRCQLNV